MSEVETVMIDSLDQFVRALHQWHSNKVQLLKHMQSVPEGTEVSNDAGQTFLLEGAYRDGFILGLTVALSEMGELPFEAEVTFTSDEPIITDPAGQSH
jgi:hypothetical protein